MRLGTGVHFRTASQGRAAASVAALGGMPETIPLATAGAREGSFPGMLESRTFNVVFVKANHGAGATDTAVPDRVVAYSGSAVQVSP